jgi:hypothetical protein
MDRGKWKLRCEKCGEIFEVEVKPGERVIILAKQAPCPSCHMSPDAEAAWHHVIGFRDSKTD